MYSDWSVFAFVALIALFFWLGILSFFIWRQAAFLRLLFPKSGERDIRRKFEEIAGAVETFKGALSKLEQEVFRISGQAVKHIQRVELLRFNPYGDTGGDISFTVSLLDRDGSGVVLTSLHSRSGTRIFAKNIILGKSEKYELSKEEQLVIKKAMNQ